MACKDFGPPVYLLWGRSKVQELRFQELMSLGSLGVRSLALLGLRELGFQKPTSLRNLVVWDISRGFGGLELDLPFASGI